MRRNGDIAGQPDASPNGGSATPPSDAGANRSVIPESGVNFDKIIQKRRKNAIPSGRFLQQSMNLQPHRFIR